MTFYNCACYYTNNIFLEEYKIHVKFIDEEQFRQEYEQILREKGCDTNEQLDHVLQTILLEVNRRKNANKDLIRRKQIIKDLYKPYHPAIYTLKQQYLHPKFLEIWHLCNNPHVKLKDILNHLSCEAANQVYSFPVFTKEFCELFIQEIENFEKSECPKGRPNTMNNYGILLNELGFDEDFITPLREIYLRPITSILYPDWGGDCLDSHKAFVVTYKLGHDINLSYHYDNSEVTLNIALGKQFTGSGLYFGDMKSNSGKVSTSGFTKYDHQLGVGLLHRGQHMHGASPLTSGERYNIIIWMRSSEIRNKLCPMCNKRPTLVPCSGFGDGFTTGKMVELCATL
ncbi:2-oxoglutarate and iron-dependent oxygenase domain-containing protein 2 [Patella vulgata]|uniref:2-oxoglutarate and iron-dependent oxygenase domain-containing protein 2 n=1 Tax=Patella vulgata TaxID=6465 RepID=UPI00217FA9AF|nr:2-oxoglutarate and iron-dependent oxygenase domain-containing protein 2 [Patella vulgata]